MRDPKRWDVRLMLCIVATLLFASTVSAEDIEIIEVHQVGGIQESSNVLSYQVAALLDTDWQAIDIELAVRDTEAIYAQCGVTVRPAVVHWLRVHEKFHYLSEAEQAQLLTELVPDRPLVFFVKETVDRDIAYSYLFSAPVASRGTAWITRRTNPTCTGALLAHELGHIFLDDTHHSLDPHNLMAYTCTHSNIENAIPTNTKLSEAQCEDLRAPR